MSTKLVSASAAKVLRNPVISVVLGVYNAEHSLRVSLESLLRQTYEHFEVVVVDDGSTDRSAEIASAMAKRDDRIRVHKQCNQGLTAALNVGVALSNGEFIARMDAGDVSLPNRLERQLGFLQKNSSVVAVGSGVRRVAESGAFLGQIDGISSPLEVTRRLVEDGVSLVHPASMFRRDTFDRVGGYRTEFHFAQDIDLWLRMTEIGLIGECPEILLELVVDDHGISATRIGQQRKLSKLARQCYEARRLGQCEQPFLDAARRVSDDSPAVLSARQSRRQKRRAHYFIGSQLLEQRNSACRKYFLRSVLEPRLTLPAIWKLVQSLVRT